MNQQTLSGMEIRILAERIVRANQGSDISLQSIIEAILRDYIMIPKHKITSAEGPVTMTFGLTPAYKEGYGAIPPQPISTPNTYPNLK